MADRMTAPTPHRAAVENAKKAYEREILIGTADEDCGHEDCPVCDAARKHTPVDAMEAAIQAYRAAMEAAGWRMVPCNPTGEMIDAAILGDKAWGLNAIPRVRAAYNAMLSAAPPPEGG